MSGLLSKVFGSRRRSARRRPEPTRGARRASRLNLEAFDERLVPAVTTGLGNGTLTLTGDAADDSVRVWYENSQVKVKDFTTGYTHSFAGTAVQRVALNGNAGDDWLNVDCWLPATFNGGAGNDLLDGGPMSDVFHGSAGTDTYRGREGQDVLYRNGFRGSFADNNTTDYDLTTGLVTGRLSADELRVRGELTVSLDPQNAKRLILNGPSGAGFALRSNWQSGNGGYVTKDPITLETAYGDVTLPAVPGTSTTVKMYGSPVAGAGNFNQIVWGGIPVTGTSNPLSALLGDKLGDAGVDLALPNISWGIALGDDVKVASGYDGAPLNNATPYLFASLNTGFSLGYGNASVSAPNTYSGRFAFAPGDGTFYAGVTGLPVVGDLGIGVSPNGYLPYTPQRIPDGTTDPKILGHFYSRGQVSLDDAGIPVAVSGDMVLDLDANDDGTLIGGVTESLITGKIGDFWGNLTSPTGMIAALANDVAVGFNGGLDLEVSVLSLNLGSASLWYRPGEVAFRAATSNPFEGIPVLEQFSGTSSFDVQGFYKSAGNQWQVKAYTANSQMFGFGGGSLGITAGSTISGIYVDGRVYLPLGLGDARLTGYVNTSTWDFSLTGDAHLGFDVGIASGSLDFDLTMKRQNGAFSFYAGVRGELIVGDDYWLGVGLSMDMGLSIMSVPLLGTQVFGSAGVTASVYFLGETYSSSIGMSFSNYGMTIDTPFGDLSFGW